LLTRDRGFGQDADARTCSKNRDRSLEKSRAVSGSGRPWPRGTGQREPEVKSRRSFCGTVHAKFGSQELVALIRARAASGAAQGQADAALRRTPKPRESMGAAARMVTIMAQGITQPDCR
jgi:hypothetical protein